MTLPSNPLQRVPPRVVLEDMLSTSDLAELTQFAVRNEARFAPATVKSRVGGGRLDTAYRMSRALDMTAFAPWRARLTTVIAPLLPGILRDLGIAPFDLAGYELELVRHNNGDFFRRHIDTGHDSGDLGQRALSMVYYFHTEPKAFEGGALRLYSLASADVFEDIEPVQNRLVAFASWVPHEVMPISCPSQRFIDSRFAINCWARMVVPGQPPTTPDQS